MPRPARSRCGPTPSPRPAPGWSWSTGTSTGTAPDGPIRAAVDVLVEPVTGSRSRLTISVDFTGYGIGKILVPLMVRRQAGKEMPANIAALKRLIEAG